MTPEKRDTYNEFAIEGGGVIVSVRGEGRRYFPFYRRLNETTVRVYGPSRPAVGDE